MNLKLFLESKFRNSWISERGIKVYVRKSNRCFDDKIYSCLDIGSVEVSEKSRGRGIFSTFLKRFEEEAKKLGAAVYVESILEPRLLKFLLRSGYTRPKYDLDECPNVYKLCS